ncbi:MAG: recombinase zinc beta ribbon domain-containing protein [Planctomycetes bacterium]|nr:recombinase zinc beta ribbon domain-containing protein [Planctomycetota bacterium]
MVKRDAHPPIIERGLFDAVQRNLAAHPSRPRGHVEEYLLTGLLTCGNCGDILFGTRRTRRKVVAGAEKLYVDVIYVCAGSLRQTGRCRQVALPRDALEGAILRVVDEEILGGDGLTRLERALRDELARRAGIDRSGELAALEKREADLTQQVTDAARRMLRVDEALLPEAREAAAEMKRDLERVRRSLETARSSARASTGGEDSIRRLLDSLRSMRGVLADRTFPLERRREVLRRFLPKRGDERPIRVEFDPTAKRGWRNALKRVTVRHLTTRAVTRTETGAVTDGAGLSQASVVAGVGFEPTTSGL